MWRGIDRTVALALLAGAAGLACSSNDDTKNAPSSTEPAPAPTGVYIALVRGTLAGDLASAKSKHDQIAHGGESNAKNAGDSAHHAMLGTKWLDSKENEF